MISSIKAKFFLLAILIVWIGIAYQIWELVAVAAAASFISERGKAWNKSLWMLMDILVNWVLGGHDKTTVSSEVGNLQNQGSKTAHAAAAVINFGFFIFVGQQDHCRASIENEDIHRFGARYAIIGFLTYCAVFYFAEIA